MCRQLSISPGTKRNEALEILLEMESGNSDGFGYGYVQDGKFSIFKSPLSLSSLLKRKVPILSHLPHSNGYTIAHLRARSCGEVSKANSHPFETDKYLICHNGNYGLPNERKITKLLLNKLGAKFSSETDSEVAAFLIDTISPKKFTKEMNYEGTFLCLDKQGNLEICKTSGDLALHRRKDKTVIISSEFDEEIYKNSELPDGYFKFSPDGECLEYKEKESYLSSQNHVWDSKTLSYNYKTYKKEDDDLSSGGWKYNAQTNSWDNIKVDRRLPSCYRGMCE